MGPSPGCFNVNTSATLWGVHDPRPAPSARPTRVCLHHARSSGPGVRRSGYGRHGSRRQTGRRVLRIRQWLVAPPRRDSGRSEHLRGERDSHRADRPQGRRPHPRSRERSGAGRLRSAAGGRLLCRFPGHDRDRDGGTRAPSAYARLHRGHQRPPWARPVPRLDPPGRRRRAEQHQLLHREPVRPLGGPGPGRSRPVFAVPAPGWSRHAGPELLSRLRGDHGHDPGRVPEARRSDAAARRRGRAGPPCRGNRRAREGHRRGALEPGAVGRREQGQQSLGPRRLRLQGSGPRLGGLLRRGRPFPAEAVRGVATQCRHRNRQAGGVRVAGDLEGLSHLPCDPVTGRGLACRVRPAVIRLLRTGAERRQTAAGALEAGGGCHQRCGRVHRREAVRRALLPGGGEDPGAADGREHHRGLPRSHRRPGLDGPPPRRKPRPSWRCSRSA